MHIVWKSMPFGLAAGLSLALVLWFAGFVSERTGGITWTFLFVGLAGAVAVTIYILVRWLTGLWFENTFERVTTAIYHVQDNLAKGGPEPLTRDDIRAIPAALASLLPDVARLAGILLAVIMFMGLMLQFVTLANAAVMYLQAKRLEEQNALLTEQVRQVNFEFLRELSVNRRAIVEDLRAARGFVEGDASFDQGVVANLGIVPGFVEDRTGLVMSDAFDLTLCNDPDQPCGDMTLDELLEMVRQGAIVATPQNTTSLRGFHRVIKVAEAIALPLMLDAAEVDLSTVIENKEKLLGDAADSCASLGGPLAAELWSGISGSGFAAIDSWPTDDEAKIIPGYTLLLPQLSDKANFLGFAAGLGILMDIAGEPGGAGGVTAQGAMIILSDGLSGVGGASESLIDDCRRAQDDAEAGFKALTDRRQVIMDTLQ